MVSFQCNNCGDVIKKPKLDQHKRQCGGSFTCIDCHTVFTGDSHKSHTSCISEAEKYQGKLYKGPKNKQQKQQAKQTGQKDNKEEKKDNNNNKEEKKDNNNKEEKKENKEKNASENTANGEAKGNEKQETSKDQPTESDNTKSSPEKKKKRKRSEVSNTPEESESKPAKKQKTEESTEKMEVDTAAESLAESAAESTKANGTDAEAATHVIDLDSLKWRKVICKFVKKHGGSVNYESVKSEVVNHLLEPITEQLKAKLSTVFDEKVKASNKLKVDGENLVLAKNKK